MPTPLDQAIRLLKDQVTPLLKDVANQPGGVLVSGVDTLISGPLYVMGFNPGGAPDEVGVPTIGSSLAAATKQKDRNEWTDKPYGPGKSFTPFQVNTQTVFNQLGADPRRTFSTNALFVRARVADDISGPWQLWWDTCWPVHRLFLDVVRPRVVVCLGGANPPDGSTVELLRHTRGLVDGKYPTNFPAPGKGETARDGRWHPRVTLDLPSGPHTCAVLALPHPSAQPNAQGACWPLSLKAMEKVDLARTVAV